MKNPNKLIIISGGSISKNYLKKQIEKFSDYGIISVDRGTNYIFQLGVQPDLIIGDFDSVNMESLNYYQKMGVKVIRHPKEKDLTDTHLAIEYAINNNYKEIILLGVTGNRLDHTLSNLFVIEKYISKANIKIINENNSIEYLSGKGHLIVNKDGYKYISLIPLSDEVINITSQGLKYELLNSNLYRKDSMGVSNELTDSYGKISIEKGLLLVIKSND